MTPSDTPAPGGNGSPHGIAGIYQLTHLGGTAGGSINGESGKTSINILCGTGSGGGASSTTGNGGNGGNGGGYGGGGGGGGAANNGHQSGAGGNGAPGRAIIITYF